MKDATKPAEAAVVPVAAGGAKPARKAGLPESTEGLPWPSNHEIKKESNPFTDRDWRMLAYAWSGLFVRFAIIIGGIFSIYQYLQNSEEKRMSRTFDMLEDWEKPEYQTAQLALRQRLADLNAKYAGILPAKPSATEYSVYMDRIGLEAMTAEGGSMALPEFKQNFDRISSFLNRVAMCAQANQCSREMTDDYFRDFAASWWNYFGKYSRQMRASGSTTYAVPIEEFVTGKRPAITTNNFAASAR